jgi:hypothetical protein
MATEKRLIDAEALCFRFVELCRLIDCVDDCVFHVDTIIDEIEEAPTVDVVEVVHGRWLTDSATGISFCSECNCDAVEADTNYCPECGAKMDGDGNG